MTNCLGRTGSAYSRRKKWNFWGTPEHSLTRTKFCTWTIFDRKPVRITEQIIIVQWGSDNAQRCYYTAPYLVECNLWNYVRDTIQDILRSYLDRHFHAVWNFLLIEMFWESTGFLRTTNCYFVYHWLGPLSEAWGLWWDDCIIEASYFLYASWHVEKGQGFDCIVTSTVMITLQPNECLWLSSHRLQLYSSGDMNL